VEEYDDPFHSGSHPEVVARCTLPSSASDDNAEGEEEERGECWSDGKAAVDPLDRGRLVGADFDPRRCACLGCDIMNVGGWGRN